MDNKEIHSNSFSGGLVTDLHPFLASNQTLTDAINATIMTDGNNQQMMQNDMGNAYTGYSLTKDFIPLSIKVYNNIAYILSYNHNTKEVELGSFPSPDYTKINTVSNTCKLSNNYRPLNNLIVNNKRQPFRILNSVAYSTINLSSNINMVLQPSYDGSVNIIWTDGQDDIRLVNSGFSIRENDDVEIVERTSKNDTNKYSLSTLNNDTRLLIDNNIEIPYFSVESINGNGILDCGIYNFYLKLLDSDKNSTDFVAHTLGVPILKGYELEQYLDEDNNSGKSIILTINNLNTSRFEFVEIWYSITRGVNNASVELKKINNLYKIESNNFKITVSGYEATESRDSKEVLVTSTGLKTAKTLEQTNDRLFLGAPIYGMRDDKALLSYSRRCTVTSNVEFIEGLTYFTSPLNVANRLGYFPFEIEKVGIVFIYNDGTFSPVCPVTGQFDITGNPFNSSMVDMKPTIKEGWVFNGTMYSNTDGVVLTRKESTVVSGNSLSNIYLDLKLSTNYNIEYTDPTTKQVSTIDIRSITKGYFIVRVDKDERHYNVIGQGYTLPMGKYNVQSLYNSKGADSTTYINDNGSEMTSVPLRDIMTLARFKDNGSNEIDINTAPVVNKNYLPNNIEHCALYIPDYYYNPSVLSSYVFPNNFNSTCTIRKIGSIDERNSSSPIETKSPDSINRTSFYLQKNTVNESVSGGIRLILEGKAYSNFTTVLGGKTKADDTDGKHFTHLKYNDYLVFTDGGKSTTSSQYSFNIFDILKKPSFSFESVTSTFNDYDYYKPCSIRFSWNNNPSNTLKVYGGDCYLIPFYIQIFKGNNTKELGLPSRFTISSDGKAYMFIGGILRQKYNNLCKPKQTKEGGNVYPSIYRDGYSDSLASLGWTPKLGNTLLSKILPDITLLQLDKTIPYIRKEFDTRIVYTNTATFGSTANGYRSIRGITYQDYPKDSGSIRQLISLNSQLYVVQNHSIASVNLNQKAMIDNLVVGEYGVLPTQLDYITNRYGSNYIVNKSDTAIYGVDSKQGVIWKLSQGNIEIITDLKIASMVRPFIEAVDKQPRDILNNNITIHYSFMDRSMLFCIKLGNYTGQWYNNGNDGVFKGKFLTVAYNELLQQFSSRYSYAPLQVFNISHKTYNINGIRVVKQEDGITDLRKQSEERPAVNTVDGLKIWVKLKEKGNSFELVANKPTHSSISSSNIVINTNSLSEPFDTMITVEDITSPSVSYSPAETTNYRYSYQPVYSDVDNGNLESHQYIDVYKPLVLQTSVENGVEFDTIGMNITYPVLSTFPGNEFISAFDYYPQTPNINSTILLREENKSFKETYVNFVVNKSNGLITQAIAESYYEKYMQNSIVKDVLENRKPVQYPNMSCNDFIDSPQTINNSFKTELTKVSTELLSQYPVEFISQIQVEGQNAIGSIDKLSTVNSGYNRNYLQGNNTLPSNDGPVNAQFLIQHGVINYGDGYGDIAYSEDVRYFADVLSGSPINTNNNKIIRNSTDGTIVDLLFDLVGNYSLGTVKIPQLNNGHDNISLDVNSKSFEITFRLYLDGAPLTNIISEDSITGILTSEFIGVGTDQFNNPADIYSANITPSKSTIKLNIPNEYQDNVNVTKYVVKMVIQQKYDVTISASGNTPWYDGIVVYNLEAVKFNIKTPGTGETIDTYTPSPFYFYFGSGSEGACKSYSKTITNGGEANPSWRYTSIQSAVTDGSNLKIKPVTYSGNTSTPSIEPANMTVDVINNKNEIIASKSIEKSQSIVNGNPAELIIPLPINTESAYHSYRVTNNDYNISSNGIMKLEASSINTYCNFFGAQKRYEIEFVVNPSADVQKILDTIMISGNKAKPVEIYIGTMADDYAFVSYYDSNGNPINEGTVVYDKSKHSAVYEDDGTPIPNPKEYTYKQTIIDRDGGIYKSTKANRIDPIDGAVSGTIRHNLRSNIIFSNYTYKEDVNLIQIRTDIDFNMQNPNKPKRDSNGNIIPNQRMSTLMSSNPIRNLRDKAFRVRVVYEGADYVLIQGIVSYLTKSLS